MGGREKIYILSGVKSRLRTFIRKYEDHPSQHLRFSQLHLISFKFNIPDRFIVSDKKTRF